MKAHILRNVVIILLILTLSNLAASFVTLKAARELSIMENVRAARVNSELVRLSLLIEQMHNMQTVHYAKKVGLW